MNNDYAYLEKMKVKKRGPLPIPGTWGELKLLLKANGVLDTDKIFMIDIGPDKDLYIERDKYGNVEIQSDTIIDTEKIQRKYSKLI